MLSLQGMISLSECDLGSNPKALQTGWLLVIGAVEQIRDIFDGLTALRLRHCGASTGRRLSPPKEGRVSGEFTKPCRETPAI